MVKVIPKQTADIRNIDLIIWLVACDTIQMLRDTQLKVSVKDAAKVPSSWLICVIWSRDGLWQLIAANIFKNITIEPLKRCALIDWIQTLHTCKTKVQWMYFWITNLYIWKNKVIFLVRNQHTYVSLWIMCENNLYLQTFHTFWF